MQKESIIKSTRCCDSKEDPGGEITWGFRNFWYTGGSSRIGEGYYRGVYVMIRFKKEVGVDSKEEQADVEYDPDEEEMDDVNLDYER